MSAEAKFALGQRVQWCVRGVWKAGRILEIVEPLQTPRTKLKSGGDIPFSFLTYVVAGRRLTLRKRETGPLTAPQWLPEAELRTI